MKLSDLKNSRFMTKEDVDPPKLATISHVDQQNVAPADQKPEHRWVLHFKEAEHKPLVLNVTNGQAIGDITGSDDSDDWSGARIVLFHDPNVSFGGKRVGGVRLRAPAPQAAPQPSAAMPAEDIPW